MQLHRLFFFSPSHSAGGFEEESGAAGSLL
jgi:hypothetical protein